MKVVRRWTLGGQPHGIATGADGTLYVGLAQPQAVIAVDPKSGRVLRRVVLDSADIASTKELVTLRTNAAGSRLYIANGSDESASILSLPDLGVVREITMEGEAIRDIVPDPQGRYLYLLGRRVHVYDGTGEKELHVLPIEEPMAIAAGAKALAVAATNDFGNAKATAVALYDTGTFRELGRDPLETTDRIEGLMLSPDEKTIIAISRNHLFEKPVAHASKSMARDASGKMRMTGPTDAVVGSNAICLPEGAGPQIFALTQSGTIFFAERRCSSNGAYTGSSRRFTPASLYGVAAYAIAVDHDAATIAATDSAGYLTIYKTPPASAQNAAEAPQH